MRVTRCIHLRPFISYSDFFVALQKAFAGPAASILKKGHIMPNFEPRRAVRPSAPTPTGQDPLTEAFNTAVNAFGDPSETYMDGNPAPKTRKTKVSSFRSPATTVNQSRPVTPEQSRTVATPTTKPRELVKRDRCCSSRASSFKPGCCFDCPESRAADYLVKGTGVYFSSTIIYSACAYAAAVHGACSSLI